MRYIEIHASDRPPRRHQLEHDLLWFGSARSGTLRPRESGAGGAACAELLPDERGIRIQVLPGAPFRVSAGGVVTKSANVAWGDEVFFDDVRLTFVEVADRGRRGFMAAVALAGAALAAVLLVPSGVVSSAPAEGLSPPRFEPGRATCSLTGAGVEARAFEAERLGHAKRERYAFDATDGAEALPLLREAVACFRDAGRIQDAQRVQTELGELCERLNVDALSLGLTLSSELEREKLTDALRTVRKLQALLGTGRDGAFAGWLDTTRRNLEGKLSHPKKAATR